MSGPAQDNPNWGDIVEWDEYGPSWAKPGPPIDRGSDGSFESDMSDGDISIGTDSDGEGGIDPYSEEYMQGYKGHGSTTDLPGTEHGRPVENPLDQPLDQPVDNAPNSGPQHVDSKGNPSKLKPIEEVAEEEEATAAVEGTGERIVPRIHIPDSSGDEFYEEDYFGDWEDFELGHQPELEDLPDLPSLTEADKAEIEAQLDAQGIDWRSNAQIVDESSSMMEGAESAADSVVVLEGAEAGSVVVVEVEEGAAAEAAVAEGAAVAGEGAVIGASGAEVAAGAAAGAEVGAEAAAIGAGTAVAGAIGAATVAVGFVAAAGAVVLGTLCLFHVLSICKKKVCADPNGNWHSHKSHCSGGCYDINNYWHRRKRHCNKQYKCQDKNGFWHMHRKHCEGDSCIDKNNKWHRHQNNCDKLVCQDKVGKWHSKKKHCKRDLIAERDAAFARPDLMNVDNSYIAITNAANFKPTELGVLKEMVIMLNDNNEETSGAFFEGPGESFSVEGILTQVEHSPDVWTGNFSFAHPSTQNQVVGKWVAADPYSAEERAQKMIADIRDLKEKKANAQ